MRNIIFDEECLINHPTLLIWNRRNSNLKKKTREDAFY